MQRDAALVELGFFSLDGRFNRENPEALEQMRQADRDAAIPIRIGLIG
jgi:hypothetical protein